MHPSVLREMRRRHTQRRLAFTLVEIVVGLIVVGALSVVAYSGFRSVVNRDKDLASESRLAQVARQANGDWVSNRRWAEAVTDAAREAGITAKLDDPASPQPSLDVKTLSYRNVNTDVGMAIRNEQGFCTMGLITNRSVRTWTVKQDLGANCAGRLALQGEKAPAAYTATTLPLASPTNITATGGRGQVTVTWSSTASSHQLYRDSVLIGPASSPYVDRNVKGGMTYAYTVRSASPTGEYSPLVGPATALTAPDAPKNVVASLTNSTVSVTWSASAGTVTGYRVFNPAGVQVWQGTGTTATFTNSTPEYVTVRAYNLTGESLDSDRAYLDVQLSPPRTLQVTPSAPSRSAALSWLAPTTGTPNGYYVYLDGSKVLTVNSTSATLTGLQLSRNYSVYVTAFATSSESAASNTVSFSLAPPDRNAIPAPTLSFCAAGDPTAVRVSWTMPQDDPDNPLQGFRVFVNGSSTASAEVRAPLTTATVTGLTPGQNYSFTVQEWRTGGVSAPGTAATIMAGCLPNAPTSASLQVSPPSSGTATLVVPAVAQPAIDSFEYTCTSYRPTPTSTLGTTVTVTSPRGTAAPGATITTAISGLTTGSRYGCYVRARSPLGYSPSSVCATPQNQVDPTAAPTNPEPGCYFITILPPTAPAAPTLAKGDGQLPVSWTAVASTDVRPVDGYRVYLTANRPTKCVSSDANPCLREQSNTTASCVTTATTCTITGLTNGTEYTVYVQTYNVAFSNDGANASRTIIGPPPAPTVALSGQTTSCITVTPSATGTTAQPVTGYIVFRSGTNIATVTTSQNDCSRSAGTQYCYTAKSYNADWESAESSSVCTYTRQNPPVLTLDSGQDLIAASWTSVSGADRYEYSTDAVNWSQTTSTSQNIALNRCQSYTVYIRAYAATWGYTDSKNATQTTGCTPSSQQYMRYSEVTVGVNDSDVWRYDFCREYNTSTDTYVNVASCGAGWRGWTVETPSSSTFVRRTGIFGWDRFYAPTSRRYHYATGFTFQDYNIGGTVAAGTLNAIGQNIGGTSVSAAATTVRNCRVKVWPNGTQAVNPNNGAFGWEFSQGTAEMHVYYHADSTLPANNPPTRYGHRIVSLSSVATNTADSDNAENDRIVTLYGANNSTGADDCSAWRDKTRNGLLIGPVTPSTAGNTAAPQQSFSPYNYAGTSSGGSSNSKAGWVNLSTVSSGSYNLFSPRLKFDQWFTHTYTTWTYSARTTSG